MTRRTIQLVAGVAVIYLGGGALNSATVEDGAGRAPLRSNFVMDQYVTIDLEELPPLPEALARADGHGGGSLSLADRFRNLFSRFRATPVRANRRPVSAEFPATVRSTRWASAVVDRGVSASATATRSVAATVGCYFSIEDTDNGLWDWTYEARIFDTNNTQIQYRTNWVSSSPAASSNITANLTDGAEGTYTCKIKWWVESYAFPEVEATQTLTYLVPTGETTIGNAWSGSFPTAYKWRGRLTGGNFVGRQVWEAEGGNDVDTCHFPTSIYPYARGLTIGDPWDVVSNNDYGDDTVGWLWYIVDYYRDHDRDPCQSETDQVMKINRPGTSWASYKTNRLKMGFTDTTVWSYRAGQSVSKNY